MKITLLFAFNLFACSIAFSQQNNSISIRIGNETYSGLFEENNSQDSWTNYRNSSPMFGIQYQHLIKNSNLIGASFAYSNRIIDGIDSLGMYRSTNDFLKISLSFAREIEITERLRFQMTTGIYYTLLTSFETSSDLHLEETNVLGGIYGDFPLLFSIRDKQYLQLGYKLELDAYSKQEVNIITSGVYLGYQLRF